MRLFTAGLLLVLLSIGLVFGPGASAQSADNQPVVHAVLFYSPTCPHCHEVIQNLLIPMVDQYGNRLQILGVDVSNDQGQALYQVAIEHYQIPPTRLGVPTLVIANTVLVGSGEIPDQFPQIVADGLAGNGIDWPDIPGLSNAMAAESAAARPQPTKPASAAAAPPQTATEPQPAPTANEPLPAPRQAVAAIDPDSVPVMEAEAAPAPDPVGIGLAGLILGGMLFVLYFAGRSLSENSRHLFELSHRVARVAKSWVIPALSVAGIGVAAYLTYVEITHTPAVCGPVGNCNAVQSSSYARIAGVPVAVLGIGSYLTVIGLWLVFRFAPGQSADLSLLGLLVFSMVGVLFSIYLTALEIFVIHAVCAWCLGSAVIISAILLILAAAIRTSPAPSRHAAPA